MTGIRYRKPLLIILLCLVSISLLNANRHPETPVLNNSNDLLAATIPVNYGEVSFRERILERTEGKREPIGLVLSGGSARAFAHIGVLQYLEEQGIVPDFIVSNSMGSIVGLLYAAGLSPEQIFTVCSQLDTTQLFDLSWPLSGGFLDTSRFSSLVAAYLGDSVNLEELPIPIMIVTEDIVTKRQVRIMEGDVLTIFDAAFALPVYFPPVVYRGHLLVDGGMTNIVPLDIAYEYTDTTIVSTTFYEGKHINLRNALSVLNISIDLGKRREGVAELQKHPDAVWIRCDVEDFSFMDFAAIEDLTQRGYESARMQADKLNELDARGTTQEIRTFRSDFSARETRVLSNYRLYARVPQHTFSQQLFMGIRSFSYLDDHWYLRDDSLFGFMYQLKWKHLWVSLHGGAAWESVSPTRLYPAMSATLSYQPIAPLVLELDTVAASDENLAPSWYQRGALRFKQNYLSDSLHAEFLAQLEYRLSPSITLDSQLMHAGISLTWKRPDIRGFVLGAEGAFQLTERWERSFLHTKATMSIPVSSNFRVSVGYTGRYALDGRGDVPFYLEDGFLTRDPTLLNRGSNSTTAAPANFLVTGRFGVDWQPQNFKPTAGELLIFQNSSIGVYGDVLWNEESEWLPKVSFGTRISTTISLLGLNSLPSSLYVGYDGPANGPVWGLFFGRSL